MNYKKLKKDNPTLNNTELALLVGRYATPEYYKAMRAFNKLGSKKKVSK